VYSPSAPGSEGKPLAVFAFGGGYVSGQLETEETNCRTWVKKFGGVAVSVGYRYVEGITISRRQFTDVMHRLAPEHPWPGSHEDMYDAVKWVGVQNSCSYEVI